MNKPEIVAGKSYEVECPFLRDTYEHFDEGGGAAVPTWRPGIRWETTGDAYYQESYPEADGLGKVIYTVVDLHKLPRPYPPRVFFTRKWVDPDGKTFGKGALRIMTAEAFRRRLSAYQPSGTFGAELCLSDLMPEPPLTPSPKPLKEDVE